MQKRYSTPKKVIALGAGLLLGALGATAYAQTTAQESKKPQVVGNINYSSHRNRIDLDGTCYKGKLFDYYLLSDGTFVQTDKKGVVIRPLTVYYLDIDNDGEFGKAERDAIKKRIPILMHDAFNDMANAEFNRFLADYASKGNCANLQIKSGMNQEQLTQKEIEEAAKKIGTPSYTDPNLTVTRADVKKDKKYSLTGIVQGNVNFDSTTFGASAGLGIGNEKARINALVDSSHSLDKLVDSYSGDLSKGKKAYGTVTDTNNNSIGASLELQLALSKNWDLIMGAGVDYSTWIEETIEEIIASGNTEKSADEILKSNTNSVACGAFSPKGYIGTEIGPVRLIVGYQGRNGWFAEAGASFPLNKYDKKKEK